MAEQRNIDYVRDITNASVKLFQNDLTGAEGEKYLTECGVTDICPWSNGKFFYVRGKYGKLKLEIILVHGDKIDEYVNKYLRVAFGKAVCDSFIAEDGESYRLGSSTFHTHRNMYIILDRI